jgi:hypothetical protein
MRKRTTISLLLAAALAASCSERTPAKPDLPQSVSPGWTLKAYETSPPPPGLPAGSTPECWKADYASTGTAQIWICGYRISGSAFDAVQRARAEADTVKFQEGNYLVIAKWTGVARADITALIRAVQKTLQPK